MVREIDFGTTLAISTLGATGLAGNAFGRARRPIPVPSRAPTDSREREVITRLMHRYCFCKQSHTQPTELLSRLPRGLEISTAWMRFVRPLSSTRQKAFARAQKELWLLDYVPDPAQDPRVEDSGFGLCS
jgi:hypothetical protein